MTAAAPHLRLVGEPKSCACPDVTGVVTCSQCDGTLIVMTKREHALLLTVRDAARQYLAAHLLEERGSIRDPFSPAYSARVMEVSEATQVLRGSCAQERKARGDR